MANLLQYTDKSKAIDNKLQLLLSEIEDDYRNGNIKTETEYYYRVKNAVSNFYNSINKPSFTYREARFTPVSNDYNSMINEACADMKYIINDCQSLSDSISQSFEDCELSRNMMSYQIAYLSQKINNITENLSYNRSSGTVVFSELFNSTDYQGNATETDALKIDTDNNILMLGYSDAHKVSIESIEIDNDESNGLPGNTHTVSIKNSDIYYEGQDGIHNDIDTIYDGNLDTWYEFEIFKISSSVREACNDLGFNYSEGVSWITDDNSLVLKMHITVDSSLECSWLSLSPYIPDIKGVKACSIKECIVVTTDNTSYSLSNNAYFDNIKLFTFPAKNIKEIILTLTQGYCYPCKVGHNYYLNSNTKSMDVFRDYDTSASYARIDGTNPSVTNLGISYDPSTQWVDYNSENNTLTSSYVKDALFSDPVSTIDTSADKETVDAYRYVIGLKEISIRSYEYNDIGYYISNAFTTDNPITSVILQADEYLPGDDPEVIQYYLSFDGGTNWHKIYPISRAYAGIYKYTINNDSILNVLNTKDKRSKNINMLSDVYSLQIKIVMNKPDMDNNLYISPIVHQYKLTVETGGDTIEF